MLRANTSSSKLVSESYTQSNCSFQHAKMVRPPSPDESWCCRKHAVMFSVKNTKAKNTDFVGHEHSFLDHKTPACEFDLYDVNTSIGGRFTIQQTGGREELFERCGSLRGFARDVGGFIHISHIRIIQPEGKEAFIQMPQRSYQRSKGGRRYRNVVGLPEDLTREVEKAVLWFWNQEQRTTPEE